MTGNRRLNVRQQKFAEYYAQSGNTVQSALQAGYSETYANGRAHELLENVGVAAYLRQLTQAAAEGRILTAVERQTILSDIARSEREESKDRIKAIDTLNKMTGEYTVKVDATVQKSEKLDDILRQLGGDVLE